MKTKLVEGKKEKRNNPLKLSKGYPTMDVTNRLGLNKTFPIPSPFPKSYQSKLPWFHHPPPSLAFIFQTNKPKHKKKSV